MTRSMSYRRYFMIATAMATHRAVSATWNRTSSQGVEKKLLGTKTAPTRVAEKTNHLSCCRSSPRLRRYRMIEATGPPSMPTMKRTKATQKIAATRGDGLGPELFAFANGRDHCDDAWTRENSVT